MGIMLWTCPLGAVIVFAFEPLDPVAPFFGALSQPFIVGRNLEHQMLGFWIGQTFRHSASFLRSVAPVLWIVDVGHPSLSERPRRGKLDSNIAGVTHGLVNGQNASDERYWH
jgi:hypothetical protein